MTTDEAILRKWNFLSRKRNLPWYPRTGTRTELAALFGELGFTKGVEVGTCKGEFAKVLCEQNPALHLTCVDPWLDQGGPANQDRQDRRYALAQQALSGLNAEFIRLRSLEAVGTFGDGSLDFVYIDGNHAFDFAIRDIIEWTPKVRTEGIVAVHDYHCEVGADVIMAVNAYTHCHDIRPWYVTREHHPTAFWVRR
jgi:predicted O-methyltransferase YrrM